MRKMILIICVILLVLVMGCEEELNAPPITQTSTTTTAPEITAMTTSDRPYTDISVEDAKQMIGDNPDLIVIDVSPKWAEGHIPGSINYYVGDGSLDAAIPGLDPEADYLVYCHVDSASIAGAQKLVDAGFTNVYRLEGNYAAWVDAGYPVET